MKNSKKDNRSDLAFSLHPRLESDSIEIDELVLSNLRLHNNASWPWFILIPRITDLREYHELQPEQCAMLSNEARIVSRFILYHFSVHKINIGALGNIVPQFHFHVIGRSSDDPAWPGPVWGSLANSVYRPDDIQNIAIEWKKFKEPYFREFQQ